MALVSLQAVRALAANPREFSFVSGAADNLKKWQTRDGKFLRNLSGHDTIINALACNEDGVLVSGGDNGSLHFWDYESGCAPPPAPPPQSPSCSC